MRSPPFGEEDDYERRRHDATPRGHLTLNNGPLLSFLSSFSQGEQGTNEKHQRHNGVNCLVWKQMEEHNPDGDCDGCVYDEGPGSAEPNMARFNPHALY